MTAELEDSILLAKHFGYQVWESGGKYFAQDATRAVGSAKFDLGLVVWSTWNLMQQGPEARSSHFKALCASIRQALAEGAARQPAPFQP